MAATSLRLAAQYLFFAVAFVFIAMLTLFSFAEKEFFPNPTFECCRGHIFPLKITKLSVHNLNTYNYPLQKMDALSHSGRLLFRFEVWFRFPPGVYFFAFRANSFCAFSSIDVFGPEQSRWVYRYTKATRVLEGMPAG